MTIGKTARHHHKRRRFFKYCPIDIALKVLTTQSLRWSAPTRFNDPFDVPRRTQVNFTLQELRDACDREFLRLIETGDQTFHARLRFLQETLATHPTEVRRQIVQEYLAQQMIIDPPRSDAFEMLEEVWRSQSAMLRILCLSDVCDSPSMWDRYSGGHTGAVLELACREKSDSAWWAAKPVEYRDSRPRLPDVDWWARAITLQPTVALSDVWAEYFYVKLSEWSYEKEWRVVAYARDGEEGEFSDWPFDPADLTAVYLGYKASDQDVERLVETMLPAFHDTRILRAGLNHDSRCLTFTPLAPPTAG
jgi:hypothetical protein